MKTPSFAVATGKEGTMAARLSFVSHETGCTTSESFTSQGEDVGVSSHHQSGELSESSYQSTSDVSNEAFSNIVLSSKERAMGKENSIVRDMTVNKLRLSSLGFYGREKETSLLKRILERGTREIVFIRGYSGVGKSALASTLMPPVEKGHGAFATGKFDLQSRDVPYSGVKMACREICGKVLLTGADKLVCFREEIVAKLGDELHLLINVVPELEEIVGSQPVCRVNSSNVQDNLGALAQQVNYVFRRFMQVVCSQFEPFVMLLDDLQWADAASLELMEVLITDRECQRLMVIGCYRSNEVGRVHIVSKICRDLRERSDRGGCFNFSEIQLGNLKIPEVNQIIMSLLSIDDTTRTQRLAELCYKRTQGNVFFLISFVIMLERERLLGFNLGTFQWKWDETKIEEETVSTDNVVDLVLKKISQLSSELVQVLQAAAFLGAKFDEKIVHLVWEELNQDANKNAVTQLVEQAVDENFLESAGPSSFRWVHDKLQEAVLAMVPNDKQSSLKFDIGMILLRGLEEHERQSLLFVIVNLLNSATGLEQAVNIEIAKLSARAALKAVKLSAFQSAAKCAAIGINRLPEDKWKNHYDLTLQLHCTGAEAEGILANMEIMQVYCDEVVDKGRNTVDKLPVYFTMVDRMGTVGQIREASNLCLTVLKQLNVNVPQLSFIQAVSGVFGLFSLKKAMSSVDVQSLPLMTDPVGIAGMKFLDSVSSFCYLQKEKVLFLNVVIKMVQLTLEHGISANAPSAFASFALLVTGVLKDFETGAGYAEMALSMVEKLQMKKSESRVIFRTWAFSLVWTKPLHSSLNPLLRGYKVGMETGDTESAAYCMMAYTISAFFQSKPLETIEEDCRIYIPHMRDLGRVNTAEGTGYVWQTVKYLMGLTDTCELLSDSECERKAFPLSRNLYRSVLYACLGEYEKGADFAIVQGNDYLKKAPAAVTCLCEPFVRGVSLYAVARRTKQSKYIRNARKARKIVKSWATKGNPNSIHQAFLLDAEDAALCGNTDVASEFYADAIVLAARSGLLCDAGLASERFSDYLLHVLKDNDKAKYRMEESMQFFRDWGAHRKVNLLESQYMKIFPSLPTDAPVSEVVPHVQEVLLKP